MSYFYNQDLNYIGELFDNIGNTKSWNAFVEMSI